MQVKLNAGSSTDHCIRCQTHWLQIIYKSLLGKAPPYLSLLVPIATPTRSMRFSRYISLVIPKTNKAPLALYLICFISPSLTLFISCQSSLPITAPVNSPHNYLIPILFFFCSFAPQYLYLHIIICISITPVLMLNCNCFTLWPIYCLYLPSLTAFSQTVYRFLFCVIECTFVRLMCNCCFCRTALLYLGQVAVVEENLFSAGLPG